MNSRFTYERLPSHHAVTSAHRNETDELHGAPGSRGNERIGILTNDIDHAVIDKQAHPLKRVICYTTRENAEKVSACLNIQMDITQAIEKEMMDLSKEDRESLAKAMKLAVPN